MLFRVPTAEQVGTLARVFEDAKLPTISATSEPKGPVYLWARRETTEEEIEPALFEEKLDVTKWPPAHAGALPDAGS